MNTLDISHPLILCHKKIEIEGTKGIAVTYCMRPINHKEECDIKKKEEDDRRQP